jgi:hypothetical protein
MSTHTGVMEEPADERSVRLRLRRSDFVVREGARESLVARYGDPGWLSWLRAVAVRLSHGGVASYDQDSAKWVIADRRDRLVLSGDGRVLVAAFEATHTPNEIQAQIADGNFSIAASVQEVVTDRLDADGAAQAHARVAEMAKLGTLTWRDDTAQGGWRLAAEGDVALFDARARTLLKFFWSRLDSRDSATADDVRVALAAGTLRPARRLSWRLERAWGAGWEQTMRDVCAGLAADGAVNDHKENAYEVTGNGVSLLVTRDAQVIVSARLELTGNADEIRAAVAAGAVQAHPSSAADVSSRYRADNGTVFEHYAKALAAVSVPESTSTHWTLRLGGVEVALGTDGSTITGIMNRPTDLAEDAAARVNAGVYFIRPNVATAHADAVEGWFADVDASQFYRTPQGWRFDTGGGCVLFDGSATLVVGFESDVREAAA